MRRTPLRRVSKKRRRIMAQDAAFKRQLIDERGPFCEARMFVHHDCNAHQGLDLHHVLQRSMGGTTTRTNTLLVCRNAHMWVHDHVRESTHLGLLAGSST